ncbi:MAG TPA: HAD family hydrolase [bacterium]|jgi:putative hydrolase of the HAD superfamily|nr:HAD family hydrolase [bacterium]
MIHAGLWPTVQVPREEGQGIPRFETIFFDVGDTLIYASASTPALFDRLIADLRLGIDLAAYTTAHEEVARVFSPRVYDYLGRRQEFWMDFNRRLLAKVGIDPKDHLARAINEWFQAVEPEVLHAFPESAEALEELAKDFRLGVISNATEELTDRLERLGLRRYFASITFSQEARAEKPDPAVFRLALQRAGSRPEEAVHVGNDYEADVVGARGVGMLPVLIDRSDAFPEADCLRIRTLKELIPLLQRL